MKKPPKRRESSEEFVPPLKVAGSICGIHLDLKYHMPKKEHLCQWVRRLPGWGINTLLIEYEDKFPFRKHPFLRGADAFTPQELHRFLSEARASGLTIIPLVQSLSHFEFALEHQQLSGLGEAPDIVTQLCPSNPAALAFIRDLYEEVLEYHREDALFHCGGDETWFLGTCPACAKKKESLGLIGFWAEHMQKVMGIVREAGKRPIVWDDIFWKDFESIRTVDLPKDTILHAWNYGIRSLTPNKQSAIDSEFGGPAGVLKQIAIYHEAGYQSLAAPCCNFGQLFPPLSHSRDNARVWAMKARHEGMLGMINTAWAVFHVPLMACDAMMALTGALCRNPDAEVDERWVEELFQTEFGTETPGLAAAFETMGERWEIPLPEEYGRPFSPLPYGYMNMVLHYPGRHEDRRRRGAYPNDWDTIDFYRMYRIGIEAVRKMDLVPVHRHLDELLATLPSAVEPFRQLARTAVKHRDEAVLLATLAELKLVSARVFNHALRGKPETAGQVHHQVMALQPMLEHCLGQAYEPDGVRRLIRAWWEPLEAATRS